MELEKIKGVFFVLLGAASYGILATIVKYANNLGIHTSVLTFFQFFVGAVILVLINYFFRTGKGISKQSKRKLMAWGISLSSTSLLYYLSIQYIPVSIGIILLMQSIWMSIVLEAVLLKKNPSFQKFVGGLIAVFGTFIATNILGSEINLDWRGLLLGFGAGVSYTITLYASNSIEKEHPNFVRSLYLILGGLLFITTFWNFQIIENFQIEGVFWGALLALFGTVLPPLFFTAGFPRTGLGMGSILSSIEIPISIYSATLILGEKMAPIQWVGVLIILAAVILVNITFKREKSGLVA